MSMSKEGQPIITSPSGVRRIDIDLRSTRVKVIFINGLECIMGFKEANEQIKVNGVPVIDWYASKN